MFRRFLFSIFLLALACPSFATVFGTVRGIVHDPQHRPVADVSVKLKSATSDATQTAETDQDGTFTFSAVAVGDYLVEAEASWQVISDNNQTSNPPLEPTVVLIVNAGALEFSISYVVDYTKRTVMKDRLFSAIVGEIAKSNGKLQWNSATTTVILNQPAPADSHPLAAPDSPPAKSKVAAIQPRDAL